MIMIPILIPIRSMPRGSRWCGGEAGGRAAAGLSGAMNESCLCRRAWLCLGGPKMDAAQVDADCATDFWDGEQLVAALEQLLFTPAVADAEEEERRKNPIVEGWQAEEESEDESLRENRKQADLAARDLFFDIPAPVAEVLRPRPSRGAHGGRRGHQLKVPKARQKMLFLTLCNDNCRLRRRLHRLRIRLAVWKAKCKDMNAELRKPGGFALLSAQLEEQAQTKASNNRKGKFKRKDKARARRDSQEGQAGQGISCG